MKRRSRPPENTGNWMDTYGDMVTLLLTFFIMLYAMSNVNEQKWEVFVKSIFPDTEVEENVAVNEPVGDGEDVIEGTLKIDGELPEIVEMDDVYLMLANAMNEIGIGGVTISRGEDYTFILFEDKTFFDGDSSILTEDGEDTLDVFSRVIAPVSDSISQISVMGHTAQGDPNKPNKVRTDRLLSAMRAAEVTIYIQSQNVIQPEKLIAISYGQFRPVASSDTSEGRAKNRRVELLLLDEGADMRSMNEYYDEYRSGVHADTTIVTDGNKSGDGHGFAPAQSDPAGVSAEMSPVDNYIQESSGEQMPSQGETVESGGADVSSPATEAGNQVENVAE